MSKEVENGLLDTYSTEIDYEYLKQIEGDYDALYKYIADNFIQERYRPKKTSVEKQCKVMMQVCNQLGLKPSFDQFIFIMTDYRFVNNQAVAGAGKTTFCQLRAIKEKLINKRAGNEILSIAYNKEAEQDMLNRHRVLVTKLNNKYKGKLNMDPYIETYTFHSFAYNWIEEYRDAYPNIIKLRLKNWLILEQEALKIMQSATEMWLDDNPVLASKIQGKAFFALVKDLAALKQWQEETLDFELSDAATNPIFKETLEKVKTVDAIKQIFNYYTKLKEKRMVIDFGDVLNKFYELLKQPEVLNRIRRLYKYIIFDEFQDCSNSMLRTLHLMVNGDEKLGIPKADDIKLTIIGDVDQCLYAFRGVSVDNSLKFKEMFGADDTKIVSMSTNRRCLAPIVDLSAEIIERNVKRIKKPITPIRQNSILEVDEGKPFQKCRYKAVEFKPYKLESEYTEQIINDLRQMKSTELGDTAILYRNRSSSIMIAIELFKAGIPFVVNKGIAPYQDMYSASILQVLEMCANPTNYMFAERTLPKVLPKFKGVTSQFIRTVCQKEKERYDKDKDADSKRFWEYDFGMAQTNNNFSRKLNELQELNAAIRSGEPMYRLVNVVCSLLDTNALKFSENMPAEHLWPTIVENFMVDKPYREFIRELYDKLEIYKEKSQDFNAVKLTTFHSTKGLEYGTVYLIDLEDSIFPGREIEECEGNTELELNATESSRRLFYVAITRAKNKMVGYVSSDNPCRFMVDVSNEYLTPELITAINSVKSENIVESNEEKVEVIKENLGIDSSKVNNSAYLETLDVVQIEYNGRILEGYYDGFIHVGDYVKIQVEEEERKRKEQKAQELLQQFGVTSAAESSTSYFANGSDDGEDLFDV